MKAQKIEIKWKEEDFVRGYTEIFINGHKINQIHKFSLSQQAGYIYHRLKSELTATDISVDSRCLLENELDQDPKKLNQLIVNKMEGSDKYDKRVIESQLRL